MLATGGAGQLFSVTTNPPESTGDGVAMALRAGVPTADVEFVQFHPTALHHPAMPRPLLSEALRGHGALLRDRDGERFVDELASRDKVSRAMAARMAEQGVDHLWLDATGLERFSARFPTIAGSLSSIGLDPERDWLPIAPAAHHLSGGVVTDLWGATALPGLWAVGEVACTGVHGANRLASNSLLEGMVFGARLAERIASGTRGPEASGALRAVLGHDPIDGIGCTVVERNAALVRPAGSVAGPGHHEVARHAAARHDTGCRRRAHGRVPPGSPRRRRGHGGGRGRQRGLGRRRGAGRHVAAGGCAAGLGARPYREPGCPPAARIPRTGPVLAAPARPRTGAGRRSGSPVDVSERESDEAYTRAVVAAVDRALAEDLGPEGDVTAALVPAAATAQFALRARHSGVLAGSACATQAFARVDPELELDWHVVDGTELSAGDTVLEVTGRLRPILTAERTALNFLGHLSGIATLTAQFVAAAHERNPSVDVLDTRKTTPGLRVLQKAAVRAGGGTNHRAGLSDAVLLKDNHLAGTSITAAVEQARTRWPGRMVEVECDALDQVAEAARAGADAVLLDNMDPGTVVEAIALAHRDATGPILTEVSGGITLATIGAYAAAGPDRISVGALTHSAPVLDLGLDLIWADAGGTRTATAATGRTAGGGE